MSSRINIGCLTRTEIRMDLDDPSYKNDMEMKEFVQVEFAPMFLDNDQAMNSLPKYMSSIQPLIQLSAFLYYIKKDRHVHHIHKIHALFCDKLEDIEFKKGVHKWIVSIIAALLTQADQVLKMFPVLTGLGE